MLRDLGIVVEGPEAHILEVWNKIDRLDPIERDELVNAAARRNKGRPVLISALTGEGIPDLFAEIDRQLSVDDETVSLVLPASAGGLAHWLHENSDVIGREAGDDGSTRYRIRIAKSKRGRLESQLERAGLPAPDAPA